MEQVRRLWAVAASNPGPGINDPVARPPGNGRYLGENCRVTGSFVACDVISSA